MSKHKFFDAILKKDKSLIYLTEIGNIAKNHFVQNFQKQGFVDSGLAKWKDVKRRQKKTGSVANRTNPILQGKGSGKLRKLKMLSLNYNTIKIHTTSDTDKYAKIHNEGGVISKSATTKILNFRNRDNDWNKKTKKYGQGTKFSTAKKAQYSQKVSIGAHSFKMPKRQFIGDSKMLDKKIKAKIKQQLKKYFA